MERKGSKSSEHMADVVSKCVNILGYYTTPNRVINITNNTQIPTTLCEVLRVRAFAKVYEDYVINGKPYTGSFELLSGVFSSIMNTLGDYKTFNYGEDKSNTLRDIQGILYMKDVSCTSLFDLAAEVFTFIINHDICREYSVAVAFMIAIIIINQEFGVMDIPYGFLQDADMFYTLRKTYNASNACNAFTCADLMEEIDEG